MSERNNRITHVPRWFSTPIYTYIFSKCSLLLQTHMRAFLPHPSLLRISIFRGRSFSHTLRGYSAIFRLTSMEFHVVKCHLWIPSLLSYTLLLKFCYPQWNSPFMLTYAAIVKKTMKLWGLAHRKLICFIFEKFLWWQIRFLLLQIMSSNRTLCLEN